MFRDYLVKFAIIRYVLIPKQLLSFDEAYTKDSYEFKNWFLSKNSEYSIIKCEKFLEFFTDLRDLGLNYFEKCKRIVAFLESMPFIDCSSFGDLNSYNPFDDFEELEVDNYLLGQHIPIELDSESDEASIFYAENPEKYYDWYKNLTDKSFFGILHLYKNFLTEIKAITADRNS